MFKETRVCLKRMILIELIRMVLYISDSQNPRFKPTSF